MTKSRETKGPVLGMLHIRLYNIKLYRLLQCSTLGAQNSGQNSAIIQ